MKHPTTIKEGISFLITNNPEFLVAGVYAAGVSCMKSIEAAHGIKNEGSVGIGCVVILIAGGFSKVWLKKPDTKEATPNDKN